MTSLPTTWPTRYSNSARPDIFFPTQGTRQAVLQDETYRRAQAAVDEWVKTTPPAGEIHLWQEPSWREPFATFRIISTTLSRPIGTLRLPYKNNLDGTPCVQQAVADYEDELERTTWLSHNLLPRLQHGDAQVPNVLYASREKLAYITSWQGDRMLPSAALANKAAFANTLVALHQLPVEDGLLPFSRDAKPNWLETLNIAERVHSTTFSHDRAYVLSITDLDHALTAELEKVQPATLSPTHNDFYFANARSLGEEQQFTLSGVRHLRLGDVTQDIANWACWGDASLTQAQTMLPHREHWESWRLLGLRMAKIDLTRHVFAAQNAMRGPVSPYAGWRLKEDLEALSKR